MGLCHGCSPPSPECFQWDLLYPHMREDGAKRTVEILDVGCGFGGLLFGLKEVTTDENMLGLEIRKKVSDYVRLRILAGRREGDKGAERIAVMRTNAMKYLPCYFAKGQLKKMFFCFPDPHFKRTNHRRRIISPALLSDYAYLLREGGRLYTITDVEPLHQWMATHGEEHPYFRRLTDAELETDPCIDVMRYSTEESKKVDREGRSKFVAVFERLPDAAADAEAARLPFFGGYYGGVAVARQDLS